MLRTKRCWGIPLLLLLIFSGNLTTLQATTKCSRHLIKRFPRSHLGRSNGHIRNKFLTRTHTSSLSLNKRQPITPWGMTALTTTSDLPDIGSKPLSSMWTQRSSGFYDHHSHQNNTWYIRFILPSLLGLGIAIHAKKHKVEAKGYRGYTGYYPYDCSWKNKFRKQAEEALTEADKFIELFHQPYIKSAVKHKVGIAILMELLWAHDQGDYICNKHTDAYFCYVAGSLACYQFEDNMRVRRQYAYQLTSKADHIRDLLGVSHPPGWEEKVIPFIKGAAKTLAIFQGVGLAIGVLGPAAPFVLGAAMVGQFGYKGYRHLFDGKALQIEYEEKIRRELYVRAACADEYYIQQAEQWGGYFVSIALIFDGLGSMLESLIELEELVELAELQELAEITKLVELEELIELAELEKVVEVGKLKQFANSRRAALIKTTQGESNVAAKQIYEERAKALISKIVKRRKYSLRNFRHNLTWLLSKCPKDHHAHHVFPKEFESFFAARGINIHDPKYGVFWEATSHLKNAKAYNAFWEKFVEKHGNATCKEIFIEGRRLMSSYGLPVSF